MAQNKGYLTAKTNKELDEYFTPKEAVIPLLNYVKKGDIIWCPFDYEDSSFVKVFQENENKVIYSHIDEGKNFFYYEPETYYDMIISNPPFSCKDDILKRLNELKKAFSLYYSLFLLCKDKNVLNIFKILRL